MTTGIEQRSPLGYSLIEDGQRIDAVDVNGVAVCGAYQPVGHDYWCLFVTRSVTRLTGLTVPPHREFYGQTGFNAAKAWVELIACLAVLARNAQTPGAAARIDAAGSTAVQRHNAHDDRPATVGEL
jgi:hypothetical protein